MAKCCCCTGDLHRAIAAISSESRSRLHIDVSFTRLEAAPVLDRSHLPQDLCRRGKPREIHGANVLEKQTDFKSALIISRSNRTSLC